MKRTLAALAALPLLASLAACGDDSGTEVAKSDASQEPTTTTTSAPTTTAATAAPTSEVDPVCGEIEDAAHSLAYEASLGNLWSTTHGKAYAPTKEALKAQKVITDATEETTDPSLSLILFDLNLTYLQVANGDEGAERDDLDAVIEDLEEKCGWE